MQTIILSNEHIVHITYEFDKPKHEQLTITTSANNRLSKSNMLDEIKKQFSLELLDEDIAINDIGRIISKDNSVAIRLITRLKNIIDKINIINAINHNVFTERYDDDLPF